MKQTRVTVSTLSELTADDILVIKNALYCFGHLDIKNASTQSMLLDGKGTTQSDHARSLHDQLR